jgi:hypothetical protein
MQVVREDVLLISATHVYPAHVLFSALSITKDESFFLWQINRLRYAVPDRCHWLAGGKKARCGGKR